MAEPCLRNSHYTCVSNWKGQATYVSPFGPSETANQLSLLPMRDPLEGVAYQ